jgi:hypothetical protein
MRRSAVATNRWFFLLLPAVLIAILAGCGGSTANVQNPQPPPASSISIAFQPQPGGALAVGFSETLIAVVSNDSNNYGVDWTLTCQNPPDCGALTVNGSPASHTASGSPITYTAPSTLSANSMVVEIVALATADQTKNVVAPVTVSTFDSGLLPGNYVLQAQGIANSVPYQFAGVITLDGHGNVTGGEQTVNNGGVSLTDRIISVGSSYFLGSDGRGTITLNTGDNSIGGNGIETFAFVFLNNSPYPQVQNPHALISQMDLGSAATGASATGTMDLQDSTGIAAAPSGSYAFAVSGSDVLDGMVPLAFGGVFNIGSGQTITGVADEIIKQGQKLSGAPFGAGSKVSLPDLFGQVTFTLAGLVSANHPKPIILILTGYIVDATHIKLIESDTNANSGIAGFGVTGGLAIGQPAGSYGNFSNASLPSGTSYVFGVTGVDLSPNSASNGYLPLTLTSAGLFQVDGNGNIVTNSGYTDTSLLYNVAQKNPQTGAQISSSFSGTYAVDSSGTGRTTIGCTACTPATSITFNAALNPSYRPEFFLYLTGLTGTDPAALVLAVGDPGPQPDSHYPSLGTGVVYAQSTTTAAFSGPYGFGFAQNNGSENDGTAQLNANPAGTSQVSGLADANLAGGATQDNAFLGSFTNPTTSLPFSGTLYADPNPLQGVNNNVFPLAPSPPMAVDFYFIDPDHGFWIEMDLVNPTLPSGQVSLGSYAARNPVCDGCP